MPTLNAPTASPVVEIRIRPSSNWLHLDWRGIWNYRDLLLLLVRRDFVAKYRQTVLGPLWFILQPLVTTLIFSGLFGNILKVPTGGAPPVLFYLCGLLSWNYFSQTLGGTGNTLAGNAHLFTKVYLPRLVVPISTVISNLLAFGIQLASFLVIYGYFMVLIPASDIGPGWMILLLPIFLLQAAVLALGVGLCMSAVSAKYRDFQHLAGFLVQIWMYATPVIYPLAQIPERWRWIVALNPMTTIVEAFRLAFLRAGTVEPLYVAVSAITTILVLACGVLLFNRAERTFADTV